MTVTVSPTDSQVLAALRSFLVGILPDGTPVIQGQVNRAPEPKAKDFVVFWPIRRRRIETNVDAYEDVAYHASIAGDVMTVGDVVQGTLAAGQQVFGSGVSGTLTITGTISGTGGIGTYRVSPSQILPSQLLASGGASFLQPVEFAVQLDVHGPLGGNHAQVISTLMRDEYAVERFADLNADVYPLHADDPRQLPFTSGEQQYEDRWVVEVLLQANQTVRGIPQQFADSVQETLASIEAEFPD